MLEGLTDADAARRLAEEGTNELPSSKRNGPAHIALEVIKEPMFVLLIACGSLYLMLGDLREALLLLGFVFVVATITFLQERKTERALEALRDLSSPRALVVRDGRKLRVPGSQVVRGDILLLAEGDRVPADAVVLECTSLAVDESLLTGESVPVTKIPASQSTALQPPGGDGTPCVFSGTLVVQGQAIAQVQATGTRTEMGKIGKALTELKSERTPLQRQTGRLVTLFACLGMGLCLTVVLVFGFARGDWLRGLLAGLTLGMAMLPEEFPVVLTIFLALGAWRLSRYNVLTRRIPAVETLGAVTALCVDKTGTLTLNRMSVAELAVGGQIQPIDPQGVSLPEAFHNVVEYAILASPPDPFDPMEKAMLELGERTLAGTEHLHRDWRLLREYPLSRELLAVSRVWQSPDGGEYVIASKGAPEAIADLCHMSDEQLRGMEQAIADLAGRGRRVLGVARAAFRDGQSFPSQQHDFAFEFLGLLALADPVRPGVPEAVDECRRAGIRVIMITGDYPGTAASVARQLGMANAERVITGPELQSLPQEQVSLRVKDTNLFARMVPEQKLRLVQALQQSGEVAGMTGDGVNDAPALKAAHIGIAMGGRGTDVAREAAAIVLLDDAFESIVKGIRTGRRIFDNLKRAMLYIFVVHIPIAGLSLVPVVLGWPLVLLPVHVVFLELIIDPACTVVFEADQGDRDLMQRPPRSLSEPLFGARALATGLVQGGAELALELALLVWARGTLGDNEARAAVFTTMVLCNLGLIFVSRAATRSLLETLRAPNRPEAYVTTGALLLVAASLTIAPLRELFLFHPLPLHGIAAAIATAALSLSVAVLARRWIASPAQRGNTPLPQRLTHPS